MDPTANTGIAQQQYYAAVDLGSNSFHLVVVRVVAGSVQVVGKVKQKVRLAQGLDNNNRLSDESMERGWRCLETFAERLQDIPAGHIRVVGTATLRLAVNAQIFVDKGQAILGHPIEVISGEEEAQQIYLGVAYTSARHDTSLVIDIGGASTEVVLGTDMSPVNLVSLDMGCVTFMQRYFPEGVLSRDNFEQAMSAARKLIKPHASAFTQIPWQHCLGASGTPQAITEILVEQGNMDAIRPAYLLELIEACVAAGTMDSLHIEGLSDSRKPIFPSGLAILAALFGELGIQQMQISGGALREGLIYGMLDRLKDEDVRYQTLTQSMRKFHIDSEQAERVRDLALMLLEQVKGKVDSNGTDSQGILEAASLLHEIGLHLEYKKYHLHGAYFLQHLALEGYTQLQRQWIQDLVANHRQRVDRIRFEQYQGEQRQLIESLCRILRLATVLSIRRRDHGIPTLSLSVSQDSWQLEFPKGWLKGHPLIDAELANETWLQHKAGWQLECR